MFKLLLQYRLFILAVLIDAAMICLFVYAMADWGMIFIIIALVVGGVSSIFPIGCAWDRSNNRRCCKCGKIGALMTISSQTMDPTITKRTGIESVKTGEIYTGSSLFPSGEIYENREVEHAEITHNYKRKGRCIFCNSVQEFVERGIFSHKLY